MPYRKKLASQDEPPRNEHTLSNIPNSAMVARMFFVLALNFVFGLLINHVKYTQVSVSALMVDVALPAIATRAAFAVLGGSLIATFVIWARYGKKVGDSYFTSFYIGAAYFSVAWLPIVIGVGAITGGNTIAVADAALAVSIIGSLYFWRADLKISDYQAKHTKGESS